MRAVRPLFWQFSLRLATRHYATTMSRKGKERVSIIGELDALTLLLRTAPTQL